MKQAKLTVVIGALSTLGPFSTDTYFPSFPALAEHFGVGEIQMQSTLSWYLVALAGMNLFHGSISDSLGRRRVILAALGIYSVSALACAVAPSFGWLLALRVIQGLSAGAGMIVSRAIIRDLFHGSEAQKLMAHVAMLGGLGPVIAPIVGGWLHVWFGWRGPFIFLGTLGLGLAAACSYGLPESLPEHLRHPFQPSKLFHAYIGTIGNPPFVMSCLALAFGGAAFLLYVATAPDVVLNILHLSETQFGWMFIPIVSGLILGSMCSGWLAGRVRPALQVGSGFALMTLGALANLSVNYWLTPRIPWAVLPLTVYTLGLSLIAPIVTIEGLDMLPHRRGLASSLQGFINILVFAVVAGLIAPLVYRSGMKHALGMASFMALSWFAYCGYKARQVRTS